MQLRNCNDFSDPISPLINSSFEFQVIIIIGVDGNISVIEYSFLGFSSHKVYTLWIMMASDNEALVKVSNQGMHYKLFRSNYFINKMVTN